MARYKTIEGVNIDTEHPDFKKIKSVDELSKMEHFSHLEGDDKKKAEAKLAEAIGIASPKPTTVAAK